MLSRCYSGTCPTAAALARIPSVSSCETGHTLTSALGITAANPPDVVKVLLWAQLQQSPQGSRASHQLTRATHGLCDCDGLTSVRLGPRDRTGLSCNVAEHKPALQETLLAGGRQVGCSVLTRDCTHSKPGSGHALATCKPRDSRSAAAAGLLSSVAAHRWLHLQAASGSTLSDAQAPAAPLEPLCSAPRVSVPTVIGACRHQAIARQSHPAHRQLLCSSRAAPLLGPCTPHRPPPSKSSKIAGSHDKLHAQARFQVDCCQEAGGRCALPELQLGQGSFRTTIRVPPPALGRLAVIKEAARAGANAGGQQPQVNYHQDAGGRRVVHPGSAPGAPASGAHLQQRQQCLQADPSQRGVPGRAVPGVSFPQQPPAVGRVRGSKAGVQDVASVLSQQSGRAWPPGCAPCGSAYS